MTTTVQNSEKRINSNSQDKIRDDSLAASIPLRRLRTPVLLLRPAHTHSYSHELPQCLHLHLIHQQRITRVTRHIVRYCPYHQLKSTSSLSAQKLYDSERLDTSHTCLLSQEGGRVEVTLYTIFTLKLPVSY